MKHPFLLTTVLLFALLASTSLTAQNQEEDPPATITTLDSAMQNVRKVQLNTTVLLKSSEVNGSGGGHTAQLETSTSSRDTPVARFDFMESEEELKAGDSPKRYISRNTTSYPTELYNTDNIITFVNDNGIQAIEPVFDSMTASLVKIKSISDLSSSPDTVLVHLQVHTVTQSLNARFLVTDAKGKTSMAQLSNRTWRLDEIRFPEVMAGDTICLPFQIGLQGIAGLGGFGRGEILDSVSLPISEAWLSYSFPPPLQIRAGSTYRYNVCFSAPAAGNYKFAVITWMRRAQPAGGFTNYPVADLALVHVLPKPVEEKVVPGSKQ